MVTDCNGNKTHYINGKLYREDGPTIELADGENFWFYNDEYINCNSQEEFERIIKVKLFW